MAASDPLSAEDLRISHSKVADALKKLGELQDACDHYQEALKIEEQLVLKYPEDPSIQRDLSLSHSQVVRSNRAALPAHRPACL